MASPRIYVIDQRTLENTQYIAEIIDKLVLVAEVLP